MRTYQQLTYEQRCQIEILNRSGVRQKAIGKLVGVSQTTVSRELHRNRGERGYRHKQAQSKALQRRQSIAKR